MNCEWEPFKDKFICKNCGFIVNNNKIKKNCKAGKKLAKKPPKMTQRVQNLGKAVVNHMKTGRKHCTPEQRQERFDICKTNECGFFIKRGQEDGVCGHEKCGCYIRAKGKFLDKLSWADSECPVGMWKKIEEKPENGV